MRYARETNVSCERSKGEIERILMNYGASHFVYGTKPEGAMIQFVKENWRIKFVMPMPPKDDFRITPSGRRRHGGESAILTAWDQACRQRWRALSLVIKAKLEAVESGICSFEEEFMAHIVLPNGHTAGEHMLPRIAQAYEAGKVPELGWEG